jgi:hypothetical protein
LTAGIQSQTLMCVADENEYLQDLLVAGLHNIHPLIIESEPTPSATVPGMSPMDQGSGIVVFHEVSTSVRV